MSESLSPATHPLAITEDQYRAVCLSTGHLPREDCTKLEDLAADEHSPVLSRHHGWIIKLPEDLDTDDALNGLSKEFHAILSDAHALGYRMIEFDSDATTYDYYPEFDW